MEINHYVQYIIVRKDLIDKYDNGIMFAQACHASMAPITEQIRNSNSTATLDEIFDKETKEWINGKFNKIILQVPNKDSLLDIMELLDSDGIKYSKICEGNLDNELTCIGLKPYNKGRICPYFKKLEKL